MAINVKKYTKDQMAKMVEEAAERLESLKSENADLIEKLRKETAERIALRNDLMAKAHSVEELKADLDASKKDVTDLRNKLAESEKELSEHRAATVRRLDELKKQLADTEAALGRANACIATMEVERDQQTKDLFLWRSSAQNLHDDLLNAQERANYAEAHPWRNLWAWVKGEAARHE